MISDGGFAATCKSCAPGQVAFQGSICRDCPVNTSRKEGMTVCESCPRGYTSKAGSEYCDFDQCAPGEGIDYGTASSDTGYAACGPCPRDLYPQRLANTGGNFYNKDLSQVDFCWPCDRGQHSNRLAIDLQHNLFFH